MKFAVDTPNESNQTPSLVHLAGATPATKEPIRPTSAVNTESLILDMLIAVGRRSSIIGTASDLKLDVTGNSEDNERGLTDVVNGI